MIDVDRSYLLSEFGVTDRQEVLIRYSEIEEEIIPKIIFR